MYIDRDISERKNNEVALQEKNSNEESSSNDSRPLYRSPKEQILYSPLLKIDPTALPYSVAMAT